MSLVRLCAALSMACAPFACSSDGTRDGVRGEPEGGGGTGGDGDNIDLGNGSGEDPPFDLVDAPPTDNCGDGLLDADEACDDGNQESGDGCAGNCRYIEPGYICPLPGEPCRPFARCGDGLVVFPEQCDDGNLEAGDGCSPTCRIEIGYKCAESPSVCEPTICGDGIVEGAETCDDGNAIPFDGCDQRCQAEPRCTDEGCTSRCGDGIVMGNEECDDGNTLDGDGCSSDCKVEQGYSCEPESTCEVVAGECAMRLPIVYRDFAQSHSDFEVQCGTHVPGIARNLLNDAGKPLLVGNSNAAACVQSANSFAEWYGARDGTYATIVDSVVLFPNDNGGFVNRLNNDGDRYSRPPPDAGLQWCSNNVADGCAGCPAGYIECHAPCTPWGGDNNQVCAEYPNTDEPIYIDGNPLFFPIDGHPDALSAAAGERSVARIPQEVYGGSWEEDPSGALRNFHFTSEIAYWFQYNTGSTANLTFIGDDDVWVYINRRLAVDLGGLHVPIEGSFSIAESGDVTLISHGELTTSTIGDFGLADGGVYEIKVFHAERKKTGSSFKLTLSGFDTSRSECTGTCGDGVIVAGEECDDGAENNVGGYNRCGPDCTLGGYCGDGIVQDNEQCDDNDPNAPANCRGCRIIVVR